MENNKLQLILASASPRRKELLGHLNIPFKILTKNIPEHSESLDPEIFCREIAAQKGEAVSVDFKNMNQSCLIISSDTIVYLDGKIFGKPKNRDEARDYLNELSGKVHSVFTAVVGKLIHEGREQSFSLVEETKVTFNKITPYLMEKYLDTGDSLDKAGAYGIQGPSLTFISKVEGDYANVVGFPLSRFVIETENFLKQKFFIEDVWQKLF